MRSRLVFIALVLWLGLTSTIASAWFFASMWHQTDGRSEHRFSWWNTTERGTHDEWRVTRWSGPGKCAMSCAPLHEHAGGDELAPIDVPGWSIANTDPSEVWHEPDEPSDLPFVMEDVRGWPFPSMRCRWVMCAEEYRLPEEFVTGGVPIEPMKAPWLWKTRVAGMFDTGHEVYFREEFRALPLIPEWRGFLASLVVWSLLWTALLLVCTLPRRIRSWRLRRSGRCVRCKYIVAHHESPRCPECGSTIGAAPRSLTATVFVAAGFAAIIVPAMAVALLWHGAQTFPQLTPLHRAARWNDADAIARLLADGAKPEQPNEYTLNWAYHRTTPRDATPLMWAAAHGNVEAIEALLAGGAALKVKHGHVEQSALWIAIEAHQNDAFRTLFEKYTFDPQDEFDSTFEVVVGLAAHAGTPEMLRALIDFIDDRAHNRAFNTALASAAGSGNLANMRLLLAYGADVNGDWVDDWGHFGSSESGWDSPLRAAVERCHCDAAELLLASGAQLDGGAWPALNYVLECEDVRLLRLLAGAGMLDMPSSLARLSPDKPSPIHHAIFHNNFELARALIEAGVDARRTSPELGRTLLFEVSWEQQGRIEEWMNLLLGAGIDINHQDFAGNTALMMMAHERSIPLVRELLGAGADPSLLNHAGYSAVDFAEQNLTVEHHRFRYPSRGPDHELAQLLRDAERRARTSQ